jgi:arsenate reductase (thioredoxin)
MPRRCGPTAAEAEIEALGRSHQNEACPVCPGEVRRRWSFPDMSKATGNDEEQLAEYRRGRNAIGAPVEELVREGGG